MDVHTPSQRSYNMSRIKGKNTKPEKVIRQLLWGCGYRYQLHSKDLPGKPDIMFSRKKKVIFIHGCFWHKHNCKYFKWPTSNTNFWKNKINENVQRDRKHLQALKNSGWSYFILWECETKQKDLSPLLDRLMLFLGSPKTVERIKSPFSSSRP